MSDSKSRKQHSGDLRVKIKIKPKSARSRRAVIVVEDPQEIIASVKIQSVDRSTEAR